MKTVIHDRNCIRFVVSLITQTMDESMSAATTLSTPADQVDDLIRQVAAESEIEIEDKLRELQPGQATLKSTVSAENDKEDQLSRR